MASKISKTNREWLSINDAARHLGVSPKTIRRLIAVSTVKAYRVGSRMIRLDKAELEAAMRPIPTVKAG